MELRTLRYHAIAVAILIFIFFIISTLASNLIVPTKYTIDKTAPVYLQYAYYLDESKTLTLDDILHQPELLTHDSLSKISWSFTQQNYWLFIDLENKSLKKESIVAHFDNPMVDHLTAYLLTKENKVIETFKLGDKEDLPTLFQYSVPHIRFSLDSKSSQRLVIKVDTVGISKTPVNLYRNKEFIDLVRSQAGLWGIFVGVMLMAALYNLVLYFGIKDRVYLIYIGYIISAILLMGSVLGFGFYLWPLEWQLYFNEKVVFGNHAVSFFTLAFCTMFLRYHKDKCWRYKMSIILLSIMFILAVISLLIPENVAAPIFFFVMGLLYISCIILIYNKLRSGFRWAKFYVFSWIPLIFGAAIQAMELTGFLPYSFATRNAFLAAILCEVILMAMALADRVRYQREYALYLATHTQQTKLLNSSKLKQAFMALQAQSRSTTLCFIKIRHFNSLNTIITPSQGYALTKYIAKELELELSHEREFANLETDLNTRRRLADLSSGVFAFISTKTQSQEILESLLTKIISSLPKQYEIKGLNLQLNYSIGISSAGKSNDFEYWLKRGYLALKDAKSNTNQIGSSSSDNNLMMDVTLAAKLQKAIQMNQLALYYQPQINLLDNKVSGAEALLRWPNPTFSNLPIEELITLAEHTGIINELTLWVIEQACKDIVEFTKSGYVDHTISVNLSAKNLTINNLAEKVENILIKYQVPAHLLKFELTESAFVESQEALIKLVDNLTALGIKVVLDDFGTGYASLSYLVNYHFSELKIDKSFVFDLINNHTHQVIVQTAIDMAHKLNLSITIEGVETLEIHLLLKDMNADRTQGYLYAKALPYTDYLHFLKSQYSLKMLDSSF
ncbi:EAL domain-containing protein [Pseudoalteromonas sp. TB64]|uniref:EAL domain-containing protein n=1 Tax=Pseudoalteromonas sp. TB64 TaxID=1938600 RepID=UPI000466D9AE|nr:EAL domain-containing protein [Pseudoalteromonas sp. TB64]